MDKNKDINDKKLNSEKVIITIKKIIIILMML